MRWRPRPPQRSYPSRAQSVPPSHCEYHAGLTSSLSPTPPVSWSLEAQTNMRATLQQLQQVVHLHAALDAESDAVELSELAESATALSAGRAVALAAAVLEVMATHTLPLTDSDISTTGRPPMAANRTHVQTDWSSSAKCIGVLVMNAVYADAVGPAALISLLTTSSSSFAIRRGAVNDWQMHHRANLYLDFGKLQAGTCA